VPRFFIEVPHEAEGLACARAIHVFLTSGSHFLTHADWGCKDGVHSAWLIVDVGSKAEAMGIVPPAFRAGARIVGLTSFSLDQIEAILRRHRPAADREKASGG
jgi:hypothetical protein